KRRIIAIRYGHVSANGPRGITLIFPTASSSNCRSRLGSRAYDSASIAARRNAALCVISSPPGTLSDFARGVAAAFFAGLIARNVLRLFIRHSAFVIRHSFSDHTVSRPLLLPTPAYFPAAATDRSHTA